MFILTSYTIRTNEEHEWSNASAGMQVATSQATRHHSASWFVNGIVYIGITNSAGSIILVHVLESK